jgi:hypothetical protein
MAQSNLLERRFRWRDLRWTTRCCLLLVPCLVLVVGLEIGARLYWKLSHNVPFFHSDRLWFAFYPEWKASGVDDAPRSRDDGIFDVLVLGGSVWHPTFGNVADRVRAELTDKLGKPVRIFNLANLGMTSRDSWLKYHRLADHCFDLVVFYHGINDTFLNSVPPGFFRSNYSHAPRYRQIEMLDEHPELAWLAFPYTARFLASKYLDKLELSTRPRRAWQKYAGDLRSAACFEANLAAILDEAGERGDPVLLATFAYHVPPNYSEDGFKAKTLDYAAHVSPIHMWGDPAHVVAALDAHNAIVRKLARRPEVVGLVDARSAMPSGREYYNDICHFTKAGCDVFARMIVNGCPPLSQLGARRGTLDGDASLPENPREPNAGAARVAPLRPLDARAHSR